MTGGWQQSVTAPDRNTLLARVVLPAAATFVAMAVGFGLTAGLLLGAESLLLGSIWTRLLALVVMYVLPLFVAGVWLGNRDGLALAPPVVAGVTPLVVLVFGFAIFGGPVDTPLSVPFVTLAVAVFWTLTCACGLVVGARGLPRLRDRLAK
jgi:hypothetical protein